MLIKIAGTNKKRNLTITDRNGIEWAQDLIGNTGATSDGQFTLNPDGSSYTATQETYDWWKAYISDYNKTEADITKTAEQLGVSRWRVAAHVEANQGGDYDDHRNQAVEALKEFRKMRKE